MKPLENVEVKPRNLLVNTLQTLHQVQCPPPLPRSPALVTSMDQQGSSVLPAKASKVQLKPAMVPWWQANSIKANPILSVTMAKRGNTRGTRPSQSFVGSRRSATDCLLCAVISCSGHLHRDSWDGRSLTLFRRWFSNCVFSQLATEWIMKTDNCKNKKQAKKGGKRLLMW